MEIQSVTRAVPVRVLVVDDEPNLRDLLSTVLRREGWAVDVAASGGEAIDCARRINPHLMVLDVVLPDIDGVQVLRTLRGELPDTMVLFLTANSAVANRIDGIAAGGDDYVTKPFSVEEVVARLRGLLRRSPMLGVKATSSIVEVGDLRLNEDSHEVSRAGVDIRLTATEFSLLRFLEPAGVLHQVHVPFLGGSEDATTCRVHRRVQGAGREVRVRGDRA